MTLDPSTLVALGPLATAVVVGVFALLVRAADNIELLRRRASDKKDRDEAALLVEQKIERRAHELAEKVRLQLELKQVRDDLARLQTIARIDEVHATAKEAVAGAAAAYNEANHANNKISNLQGQIKDVVDQLPGTIAAAVPAKVVLAMTMPPPEPPAA